MNESPDDEMDEMEELHSIEDEMFETPPPEEQDPESIRKQRIEEVNNLLKLIDLVPKRTMHERLRYKYSAQLRKIVQYSMKMYNLRGLDYYHFLMLMLIFSLTRGPKIKKKRRKKKRASLDGFFVDKKTSSGSSSQEVEMNSGDPFQDYLEELKKTHPDLIENLKPKEEARKERKQLNIQKLDNAVKAYFEEKEKNETNKENDRMCFLEKKDPLLKENHLSLGDFVKREGFPASYPKSVSSEIFSQFGIDRESFERDFPLMDEDDLKKFYESILYRKDQFKEEENENDILGRRGRFPFQHDWQQGEGEEEGDSINLAKWEQKYWKWREEAEGKKAKKKKEEAEMELCQLMLVRCGTSWKQELGYTEGWSDTARLGKIGRKNMEEVAAKILKRGYKFDYVLTSSLGRSWRTADLMLSGSGQEEMIRHSCWELNPRHRGKLEGETDLGSASRWGWLPQEWFAFTTPPPISARDKMPDNIAMADTNVPATLPRAESVFHVQERVEFVWDLVRRMFKKEGKRTILICAHKDSIEALLFHIYGFSPTDFAAWQPSYTTPIILMWYMYEKKFIPAFIDFLCDIDEANLHTENLTVCWFQRFIDQGILDQKTLADIKIKMDNDEELPDLEELWDQRFNKSFRCFEKHAEKIGQKLRMMDSWLERGYIVSPDEKLKITEDNTIFKEFMEHLETIEKANDPQSDMLTIEEQIMWIVNRNVMPLESKIKNLQMLQEFMVEDTNPETKEMLGKYIEQYEKILDEQHKHKQSIIDVGKTPEEKFKDKPPKCFGELKTPDDWIWAARNKKLPGGVHIPRKLMFDDWDDESSEFLDEGGIEVEIEDEGAEEEGEINDEDQRATL